MDYSTQLTAPDDGSTTDSAQAQNFGQSHKISEPGARIGQNNSNQISFCWSSGIRTMMQDRYTCMSGGLVQMDQHTTHGHRI